MPGIFISYRRNDVAGQVGRLFERLASRYGEEFVFMDVESINLSQPFESVIQNRIRNCDIMLLAIGPKWGLAPDDGETKDFVHMELAEALSSKRPLCPLMIDRTEVLEASVLPKEFQDVFRRNAFEIRHTTFDRDADALMAGLVKLGLHPPPAFERQRFESTLLAAGWPYSLFGSASRVLRPAGALAALAVVFAGAGFLEHRSAFNRGRVAGKLEGGLVATANYEAISNKDYRDSLKIVGKITSDGIGVEDASIVLTNRRNHKSVSLTSDIDGKYLVDLADIEIREGDPVSVEVEKSRFRKTVQQAKYRDDFREFRVVLRRLEQ